MEYRFGTYKNVFEHLEKLLDRRQSTTSFYFSVNTAISAFVGLLIKDSGLKGFWLVISIFVLLGAGIIACWIWRTLLRQYEALLDWWYTRLRELEEDLPESFRLVTREYQEFYGINKNASSVQIGMTKRELALNWVFTFLYVAFGVGIIISFWL